MANNVPQTRQMQFDPSTLPVAQLESLKFKVQQTMESIQSLQMAVEAGGHNVMPSWPEILTKYNVLLSQTHSLSTNLIAAAPAQSSSQPKVNGAAGSRVQPSSSSANTNIFSRLSLHPSLGLTDAQLDNDLTPLLRNQQTTEVLAVENDTVRRISERLLEGIPQGQKTSAESQDLLLKRCSQIATEHDSRCERAVRAVRMLRENYDWKARVAVETEEPDDYIPSSPLFQTGTRTSGGRDVDMGQDKAEDDGENSGDDDEELEEVLGPSLRPTPGATPQE